MSHFDMARIISGQYGVSVNLLKVTYGYIVMVDGRDKAEVICGDRFSLRELAEKVESILDI